MKIRTFFNCLTLIIAAASVCVAAEPKLEQTIRDSDAQWSAAAAARDVDKLISFYGEDAVVLPAHATIATTRDAIRKIFQNLLSTPEINLTWKPTKVDVAGSGDIAYSLGTYDLTAPDESGKTVADHGKYVAIWKKQRDGSWKVVTDIWNSDLRFPSSPPPSPTPH